MEHRPKPLIRSMKLFGALLITLSAITPASSVFIIAPGVVQQAGTGAVLSFAAAAVVGILTALVYAELSSAFPLTGGEYAIVGRILGPLVGFIVLGVNFITFVLMFATISLGIANYIQPLFPSVDVTLAGIATVILTTALAVLNIRTNAVITGVFLMIELAVLAILTYLGLSHTHHSLTEFLLHPVYSKSAGSLEPTPLGALGLATAVAIWAYNGYGQAVYLGEETHDAPRNIARVILIALFITIIAEAVPVTAVLLGTDDLSGLLSSSSMLNDFMVGTGGTLLKTGINLGVALAILNANIAMALMSARQLYSSGRDQIWSRRVNTWLTQIHPRFNSPWMATVVFGCLSVIACFIDQKLLFVIIGTSLVLIYAIMCWAVLKGRRTGVTSHASYKMPLFPLPPILGLIFLAYVTYTNYLDEAVGRPSLWAALAMVVVSGLYYGLVLKRRGGWILDGPISLPGHEEGVAQSAFPQTRL